MPDCFAQMHDYFTKNRHNSELFFKIWTFLVDDIFLNVRISCINTLLWKGHFYALEFCKKTNFTLWNFVKELFFLNWFCERPIFLMYNFVKGVFFYVKFCKGAAKWPQISPGSTLEWSLKNQPKLENFANFIRKWRLQFDSVLN